jgi:predicted nuclease of predicted toxin-antitoxin system
VRFRKPVLKFAIDEGAPDSVGVVLREAGHKVLYLNQGKVLPRGSKDPLVCEFAMMNDAILVATDGDMRQFARSHGISNSRYKKLNLLKLSCREPIAAARVKSAMTLIEHEWHCSSAGKGKDGFSLKY